MLFDLFRSTVFFFVNFFVLRAIDGGTRLPSEIKISVLKSAADSSGSGRRRKSNNMTIISSVVGARWLAQLKVELKELKDISITALTSVELNWTFPIETRSHFGISEFRSLVGSIPQSLNDVRATDTLKVTRETAIVAINCRTFVWKMYNETLCEYIIVACAIRNNWDRFVWKKFGSIIEAIPLKLSWH